MKVRQVCKSCNNEWMSNLEMSSRAVVTSVAVGERRTNLNPGEQGQLALWLFKTGLMLALAHPQEARVVAHHEYSDFFKTRRIPDGTSIDVGRLLDDPDARGRVHLGWSNMNKIDFHRSDGSPIYPSGYRISLSIFSLVCQILRDPHGPGFGRAGEGLRAWTRIHPLSDGRWPPPLVFHPSGLEDIARGEIHNAPPESAES